MSSVCPLLHRRIQKRFSHRVGVQPIGSRLGPRLKFGVGQWLGRRSVAGGLSLIYTPDPWLTCDYFVGNASVMGQPCNEANSAFHLSVVGKQ